MPNHPPQSTLRPAPLIQPWPWDVRALRGSGIVAYVRRSRVVQAPTHPCTLSRPWDRVLGRAILLSSPFPLHQTKAVLLSTPSSSQVKFLYVKVLAFEWLGLMLWQTATWPQHTSRFRGNLVRVH